VNAQLFEVCLRIGDDALISAQRLAEWSAAAPELEEDIALSNIALDQLGVARLMLSYAGEVEGAGRDEDALAYLRDDPEFRNCLLVELPNAGPAAGPHAPIDFGVTMARLLFVSTYQLLLYQSLLDSSDERLRDIAAKARKESAYHVDHATQWTIRLGDGTEESARRMAEGLDWCWRFVPELFEVDDTMQAAIDAGIAPDPREFEDEYRSAIAAVLAEAQLEAPADQRPILGGRRGHHSEHLGHLLAPMQFLPRTYPDATW